MRPARAWGFLLLALAALACPSSETRKTDAAQASVRAFFSALPAGDCAVLGPMLATGGSARPCEETVRELLTHSLELVEILEAKVDGRDPEVVLVRAKVAQGGAVREAPFLLRAERQAGVWKLRL
ncbi:MAG: hypothetical protein JXB05_15220 [Myxococcaceae bacterium]|nr:hypothetical protein [Myxococcaceae bacterium]